MENKNVLLFINLVYLFDTMHTMLFNILIFILFQRMSVDSSGRGEDDKPIFRPLTRDSLAQIQARIDSEHAKKKELDRKRAEGEVRSLTTASDCLMIVLSDECISDTIS